MHDVYTLLGADGAPYSSRAPGTLGGHRARRGYGRLDCPAALLWISRGHYVRHRVFFADEPTALAAGFRPCARCMPERYAAWKAGGEWPRGEGVPLLREPLDSGALLAFLRARAIPGVEEVEGSTYRRALRLEHGPALVAVSLADGVADVRLVAGDSRAHAAARSCLLALLGPDPAVARAALRDDPVIGPLVAARPLLRVPGAADGFELAARAVVNQQVSLGAARTVLGRIASRYGRGVRHWNLRPFPSPDELSGADPASLPMPRRRAEALVALSRAAAAGAIDLRPGSSLEETRAALIALPGIGDWTTSYIAMRALGDPDAFPAGDLALRRALAAAGSPDPDRWRPHRAYAAQHIWAGLASQPG